jgi:hypothetical protein
MAQTNYTPIQLYYSTTAAAVPVNTNLLNGELAINIADGKLYYKDDGGTVQVIATKGAGTIGGSTTQIQYNNAGALAGSADMTYTSATNTVLLTKLNLTNALGAIYGGTGQSTYTTGDLLYSSATNTLSKLALGTANYILTVNSGGTNVQWSAPSAISVSTATNLAGGVAGSVPYQSGASTTTFLGIGAADRVMTSSGSAPQWVTALTGLTGVSSSSITNTSLTSGRVVYSTTGGLQTNSANLTFDGTTLTTAGLSNSGTSALVKLVTVGGSSFSGTTVFAAATPAKLYMGTGTVTDTTSAIGATNAVGAVASLAITPIAATNTSVTYTDAATLYIAGAPSAGTNITITNPYALYVAAGASYLGGNLGLGVAPVSGIKMTVYQDSTYAMQLMNASQKYALRVDATDSNALILSDRTGFVDLLKVSTAGFLTVTGGATIQGLTVGRGAGAVSTNTVVGNAALSGSNTGDVNTAIGYQALKVNTSGQWNVGVGAYALTANQGGVNNTAVGRALVTNVSGSDNTAIGMNALYYNTASYNTAVGSNALLNNYGSYHVAVGYQALQANTSAVSNVAVGYQAMYSFNTAAGGNVAIGDGAMYDVKHTAGTNIAIGLGTMRGVAATGAGNIAIGQAVMYPLTTGADNTIVGGYSSAVNPAGRQLTSGSYNVGMGSGALSALTLSNYNTAIGYQALYVLNRTADNNGANTALGYQAGYQITTGNASVLLGYAAGTGLTTGANNTYIGTLATASSTSVTGEIVITTGAITGKGSNTGYIYPGGGGVYQGNNGATWSVTSDQRLKKNIVDNNIGLEKITAIQVRNFEYRLPDEVDAELKPTDAIEKSGVQLGVIAQELQQVLPECVKTESTGVMSVDTDNLTWYMVNAIKELKAEVDSLKSQLNGA